MATEQERSQQQAGAQYAEPAKPEDFSQALAGLNAPKAAGKPDAAIAWLGKSMPSANVEGKKLPPIDLLDPTKKKQYEDVVRSKNFAETKDLLAQRLKSWEAALSESEDLESLLEKTQQNLEKLEELLDKNLKKAYEVIRPLETTYRSADGFFMNAAVEAGDKVKASFLNASPDQLLNPDDRSVFEEGLAAALQTRFRDWTLKETFANLVVPGWVGTVPNLDRLGTLGSQNKVQVFTDSDNFETFKQLQDNLDQKPFEGLKGAGLEKQYVSLFGNWLLGRKAHKWEDEDLWLPPSALMAGVVYKTDETKGIQEAAAGYRKGKIQNALGVRYRVDRPTGGKMLFNYGISPIVDWDGYPIAMGDANLSTKEGLDAYPRIRTEDWILKNVCHYLNKQAYQNITDTFRSAVKRDLHDFLAKCTGPDSEVKGFDITVLATPEMEKRHEVDVVLELKFQNSVRSFNVKVKDADAQLAQGA
ncbi:MAG TPA: hypothetical protein VMS93_06670 [Candidatus Saccharimonadales bacterium]|nr:hypothetical protein [Candidatus Saccharimonadales bacterium]